MPRSAPVDGFGLAYERYGTGDPVVLLPSSGGVGSSRAGQQRGQAVDQRFDHLAVAVVIEDVLALAGLPDVLPRAGDIAETEVRTARLACSDG